ncbi:MAG: glycosyltransferase family 39 protein [Planctomycetes bacterium]|nr:glycosyltransferase family 39 protein [Planctomycetota bacterium]MBI3834496.1 glycosyltransferase family 39 protein [Planctomycetota bacterium]
MPEKSDFSKGSECSWSRIDAFLMVLVCIMAVVALGKGINRGGLADADSSAHLMDGVLIHDWLKAGPGAWLHPMEFAERQYGHYPTLGIGAHYPPGFAIVEAAFFFAFGISSTTGRLCIAFFGVMLASGTYMFARRLLGCSGAALASIVMLTMPATTLWGRQTMLEVPTMAAMVWGALLFQRYLDQPTAARLAAALAGAFCVLAFKQTAIVLLGTIVLTMCALSMFRVIPFRHAAIMLVAGLATLLAVCLSLDNASARTVSGYDTFAGAWSWSALLYYARIMRYQTGTIVLLAALPGVCIAIWQVRDLSDASHSNDRRNFKTLSNVAFARSIWLFVAAWLVVSYVLATAVSLKVQRFIYVGLFPLAVFASLTACVIIRFIPTAPGRATISVAAAACVLIPAIERPVRHSPEFADVITAHREAIKGKAVLFSGLRDGDFIFAAREQLGVQNSIIVRGSKLLYTCTAGPRLDLVSYAQTPDDVRDTMRRFAFETVVVERANRVGTKEDQMLRDYLASSGDYKRVAEHRLEVTPGSACGAVWVDVYSLDQPMERQVQSYEVPIPRTGRSIRVDLHDMTVPSTDRT